jgi:hypothetical protein
MLTQLSTLKARLAIPDTDPQYDALLTNAIKSVSARFDKETNRTLARTQNATHEFDPDDTEILVPCYPIESVSKFEQKTTESEGWQEVQPAPDFLIRKNCIISLSQPFILHPSSFSLLRATYSGGYVLPGATPAPGQTPLPGDLEQAAVEQSAFWFQHRDELGIDTTWPHLGTYEKFLQSDLLPEVRAVLSRYTRYAI